eukprot:9322517-Karenia_brevis.AAC.1
MCESDVVEAIKLLVHYTDVDHLEKRSYPKLNNFVHLAASRGNLRFLETALPLVLPKFGSKDALCSGLLNAKKDKGKSCKDVASYSWNIADLIKSYGGVNVATRPDDWQEPLPKDHYWQRKWYR